MSRRRALRKPLTVSLFPFLAVLICTLGVLIVLLVLATKSAEDQAAHDHRQVQERVDQQNAQLKNLQQHLDEAETLADIIQGNRTDVMAELNQSREYRGHLESEIQKLKQTIKSLDEALANAESRPAPSKTIDLTQKKAEVEQLAQKLVAAEKELIAKRQEFQANSKVTYSIVPHEGSGGTFRRPIFLESRGESIFIQPLGIELKKSDFVPPLGPGNPLDAAVLAIREYWQKHQGEDKEGSPYPLIVIRPDGAEGYAICRRALTSWEDEFGYELVDSEKELDFGSIDPQLKQVVEEAITEARSRQQKMLAARPVARPAPQQPQGIGVGRGNYGREIDQRPGLTVSGTGGGFVVNSGWEELYNQRESMGGTELASGGDENGTSGRGSGTGMGNASFSMTEMRAGQPDAGSQSASGSSGSPGALPGQAGSTRIGAATETGGQTAASAQGASAAGAGTPGGAEGQLSSSGAAGSQGQGNMGSAPQNADSAAENCPDGQPMLYRHLNVAKSRGRDWAVPNKSQGATAYVRPIRIVCTEHELEVLSPLGVEKRIPLNGSVESAIDPLVNEIWRQIETWGMPGERSYWKPELRISVVAGGENNFEKLQGLLFESGVQIKEAGQ